MVFFISCLLFSHEYAIEKLQGKDHFCIQIKVQYEIFFKYSSIKNSRTRGFHRCRCTQPFT